jgi:hypothetical protein
MFSGLPLLVRNDCKPPLCDLFSFWIQVYHAASEGDDLATLSQGDPLALRGFETLRDIKLNQSRHNEASQDEHLLSPDTLPNQLMGKIPAWVLQQITDKVAKIGLLN